MKRHSFVAALVFSLALILAGCGSKPALEPEIEVPEASTQISSEPEEVPEELPEEDPFGAYPFGVAGLTLYDEAPENGLTKLATLECGAECDQGYLSVSNIYACSKDRALVYYITSDEPFTGWSEGEFEDPDSTRTQTYHLELIDLTTGEAVRELELPQWDQWNGWYLESQGGHLWLWKYQWDDTRQASVYDMELNLVGEFTVGNDQYGTICDDGYYVVANGQVLRYPLELGAEPEMLPVNHGFLASSFQGSFSDEEGNRYLILSGMAGDLQSGSTAIVNRKTGEIVFLRHSGETVGYYCAQNNVVQHIYYGEDDYTPHYVVNGAGGIWAYSAAGENYISMNVLTNGNLLFDSTSTAEDGGTVLTLECYNPAEGSMMGSVSITDDTGNWLWLTTVPTVYEDGRSLLLAVDRGEAGVDFYRWKPSAAAGSGLVQTQPVEAPEILVPDYADGYDPASFIPTDCPEELAPLRAKADELEERFGFDVYISTECRDIIGGYAIGDCSDYDTVSAALEQLEYEAEKYPEGFFRQFETDYLSGIDIYLTGMLIGTDSGMLSTAGGFQTVDSERIVVAIDSTFAYNLMTSFHHELSHAIDTLLSYSGEGYDLDWEGWQAMNPEPDCYTYSYSDYESGGGAQDRYQYVYMDNGWDSANAYFIDDYSLTFPTEDRARIFEYVMTDDDQSWVDWENAPHLLAKLDYFSGLIRQYFDTTGWEDVRWERFQSTEN